MPHCVFKLLFEGSFGWQTGSQCYPLKEAVTSSSYLRSQCQEWSMCLLHLHFRCSVTHLMWTHKTMYEQVLWNIMVHNIDFEWCPTTFYLLSVYLSNPVCHRCTETTVHSSAVLCQCCPLSSALYKRHILGLEIRKGHPCLTIMLGHVGTDDGFRSCKLTTLHSFSFLVLKAKYLCIQI